MNEDKTKEQLKREIERRMDEMRGDPKKTWTKIREKIIKGGEELGLPQDVIIRAKDIHEATPEMELSGKAPSGIAGASLYLAGLDTGYWRSQEEIADVVGTTTTTIRKRSKQMAPHADIKYPITPPECKEAKNILLSRISNHKEYVEEESMLASANLPFLKEALNSVDGVCRVDVSGVRDWLDRYEQAVSGEKWHEASVVLDKLEENAKIAIK